ncbi:MAG: sulfite exporter TauE/SafE family protein [Thermomicrobiales bacterium]
MNIGWPLVEAMAIVLLAGTVSGLSGFGFGLVSVPLLLLVFDPPQVVLLGVALPLVTGWMTLSDPRRDIRWPTVASLLPTAVVGAAVGVRLLHVLPKGIIMLGSGSVVIVFALIVLFGWMPPGMNHPGTTAAAGLASGTLLTSVGLSGPPVVLLLTGRELPPNAFRTTLAAYFMILNVISAVLLARSGALDYHDLRIAAILAPAGLLGALIGRSLVRFISPGRFRTFTLLMLLVTGATAIIDGLGRL